MAMRRLLLTGSTALLALLSTTVPTHAKLECRQPNYVTRDGKIYSQDPQTPGTESEITIRGVTWGGMEKDNMIPDGLWGTTLLSDKGVQATKVSTLLEFFSNNSINSVRLPLNADYIIRNPLPQLAFIHRYENRELTIGWSDANTVTYFDLIGRLVQTLQNEKISVLLDIHLLTNYLQDAYWYTPPYANITESPTYQAVSFLAQSFCNATYWNILGIDLKDEMSDVLWNGEAASSDVRSDWRSASELLANRVLELCPSWLVFVGGASSPTDAQKFSVGTSEALSSHWDGGNLHNATKNPIKTTLPNKIVFAPHAHTHGKMPQNYFYSSDTNCSTNSPIEYYGFENDQLTMECVDFIDGQKTESKYGCGSQEFGCSKYKHLSAQAIAAQYKLVMEQAVGDVVKEGKTPVIFGAFSGVYGADFQPHQTAALDFLINYASTSLRGGYFFALNPETEYFLEDPATVGGSGLFGRTHYGLFQPNSWQLPHTDLLSALSKMPSTPIPCYGQKEQPGKDKENNARGSRSGMAAIATIAAAILSMAAVML